LAYQNLEHRLFSVLERKYFHPLLSLLIVFLFATNSPSAYKQVHFGWTGTMATVSGKFVSFLCPEVCASELYQAEAEHLACCQAYIPQRLVRRRSHATFKAAPAEL
jgi:hypothetical protein